MTSIDIRRAPRSLKLVLINDNNKSGGGPISALLFMNCETLLLGSHSQTPSSSARMRKK